MKNNQLSLRYAKALFDVVSDSGKIQETKSDLEILNSIFKDKDLQEYFASPLLEESKKTEILDRLIQAGSFTDSTKNFLLLLSDRSRIYLIPEIYSSFVKTLDESMGVVRGQIKSAKELDQKERESIVAKTEKLLGKKTILEFEKDPSILGGAIVTVGDFTIDFSVDRQLNQIKESLNVGAH